MNQGWICPRCGASNAPWKGKCGCKDSGSFPVVPKPTPTPIKPFPGVPAPPEDWPWKPYKWPYPTKQFWLGAPVVISTTDGISSNV